VNAIFAALFNPILPIFAVSALGFLFGRLGLFTKDMAFTINRFVVMVALPALLFSFLASVPFEEFEGALVAIYFAASLLLYAAGFLIMRYGFKLGARESLLLGMAACFTNHVFFVLYIATILYGDAASVPVLSIITFDALLLFGGTFLFMDIVVSGARSPMAAFKILLKNPMILALVIGLFVGYLHLPVHQGILTYAHFTGSAAAPASMFALGVVLSGVSLKAFDAPALTITGMKIIAHPLLAALGFAVFFPGLSDQGGIWARTVLLTAAGPCGAMPFVIALQHGVNTERIVKAIIYSTVLSLFTLAIIASI